MKLPPEIMPCACCWKSQSFLEIADIQIFLNGDVLFNGSGWTFVVQGERVQRCSAVRIGKGCGGRHWTCEQIVCFKKHDLLLKTFIPHFVPFFVLLGIALSCIRKMSFSVTSTKRELTPAIVSLSTSQEVDTVH